jgi:hypothetical protein
VYLEQAVSPRLVAAMVFGDCRLAVALVSRYYNWIQLFVGFNVPTTLTSIYRMAYDVLPTAYH